MNRIFLADCHFGLARIPSCSVQLIIADPPFGDKFKWVHECARVVKPNGSMFILVGTSDLQEALNTVSLCNLKLYECIAWHWKPTVHSFNHYNILWVGPSDKKSLPHLIRNDVWEVERDTRRNSQGFIPMPDELIELMVGFGTDEGDIVLDIFGGIACPVAERMGRLYWGFKLD